MNKLKHQLPTHILRTIYNSLILPHLHYGVLSWRCKINKLTKIQKKAVRLIINAKYNAHTEPIFKNFKLLKATDLCALHDLKFCFKYENQMLPSYFYTIFRRNSDNHVFFTRHVNNFQLPQIHHTFAKNNIRFKMPMVYNSCPPTLKEKI